MEINVPVDPVHAADLAHKQRLFDAQSSLLLQQLVTATPAQVQTWMTANVTDLASARTVLVALALGLRYVYLKEQQQ